MVMIVCNMWGIIHAVNFHFQAQKKNCQFQNIFLKLSVKIAYNCVSTTNTSFFKFSLDQRNEEDSHKTKRKIKCASRTRKPFWWLEYHTQAIDINEVITEFGQSAFDHSHFRQWNHVEFKMNNWIELWWILT